VRRFLDTRVLIAARGGPGGSSCRLIELAKPQGWDLRITPLVLAEARNHLADPTHDEGWIASIGKPRFRLCPDVVSWGWVTVAVLEKDRPILFTARLFADVLITLDRKHFQHLIGEAFYTMPILTPAAFLRSQKL
jgi:predicted nucleic acid-binding protein